MSETGKILKFDAAAIAANAVAAATTPPDAKRPLYRDIAPAADYPVDALGALREVAEAIQLKTQAPLAICAQSVLAAASFAVAPHYDVALLDGAKPLTVLCLSIAESGERKSSVDNLALAPVFAKEERLRADYEAQSQYYAADHAAWKAATEQAKKAAKNGRAAAREAIAAVGSEPKAPPSPMLLMADATPEGIVMHLAESRPWGGVFSAEGGLMLGGHGMSDESKIRTAALFNSLWDGTPIRRRRVLTGTSFLPGRRCSMHLMTQPGVAEILTHDPAFADIGLMARLLIVAPASTAGTRKYREAPALCTTILADYKTRLMAFLDKPHRMLDGSGGLDPVELTLTADARAMLIAFHDEVEGALTSGGELSAIRGFASKMAEHAGRLAAILAVYGDPEAVDVGAKAMANGIALAEHYSSEMKRLADGASIAPDLQLARRLLEWWQVGGKPKRHLSEIYQRGLNAIGDAATARKIVAILEESGWVKRLPPGTVLDGSPRRDAWELS
ncbi:MAG TPA: YfjI family protein [Acetobacteraceae bacterium]|nr:YfjI family protein [Acetobacteraceae bacterium]